MYWDKKQGRMVHDWDDDVEQGYECGMWNGEKVFLCGHWKYLVSDGGATIFAYLGKTRDEKREIEIPGDLGGHPVTGIGVDGVKVFGGVCARSVKICSTAKRIGALAFYGSQIEEIDLPDGLLSIGNSAFERSAFTSVAIPDSVRCVGYGAFRYARAERVIFPAGIEKIEDSMFFLCEELSGFVIPSGVKEIGLRAFAHCKSLHALQIPDSVTKIGTAAFEGMDWTCVRLPDGVVHIGERLFSSCTGLKEVFLPEALETIGNHAFWHCDALERLTVPRSVTQIDDMAFADCAALRCVMIPGGNTCVGRDAFKGCPDQLMIITCADSPAQAYAMENHITCIAYHG